MKTLASTLSHKSHYPESHYQYSISNGIGITKISFFSYKFFWEKIEHLFPIHLNIPFFCLVIQHQYHFDTITNFSTIFYPLNQRQPLVFQTNGCLNFQKHPPISILEKIVTSHLPSKTSMLESFLSTLESFSKNC